MTRYNFGEINTNTYFFFSFYQSHPIFWEKYKSRDQWRESQSLRGRELDLWTLIIYTRVDSNREDPYKKGTREMEWAPPLKKNTYWRRRRQAPCLTRPHYHTRLRFWKVYRERKIRANQIRMGLSTTISILSPLILSFFLCPSTSHSTFWEQS